MIASLHGKLETIDGGSAVVNVGGVGFLVHMPTSTIANLGAIGQEVHLHTCLMVRDDSLALYGFGTEEEMEMFQILTSVSGLGPKLAMAVLSTLSVEQASMAIASGSAEMLMTVPGIGKKMAERLILELRDKIGIIMLSAPEGRLVRDSAEVISALTSLGYTLSEATRAVATLPPASKLSLEEKIKLALQYFASK